MSESIPPSVQPEQPQQPQQSADRAPAAAENRGRAALGRLVPRSKGARWAVLGASVVVVGGGVAAVAVAEHHHGRGDRGLHVVRAVPGHGGGPVERRLEGAGPGHGRGDVAREDGAPLVGPKERGGAGLHGVPGLRGGSAGTAPAPLPSLAIGDAADKAAAAVTGGKVESLRVVAQEGGGSAWLAVVLGPDGVRHAVTVSGTDGSVSSNTTLDR